MIDLDELEGTLGDIAAYLKRCAEALELIEERTRPPVMADFQVDRFYRRAHG